MSAPIDNIYYMVLDDPAAEGLNGVSIQQLITHVCNNYMHISQPKINANMSNFHQGINAALLLSIASRMDKDRKVVTNL